MTHLFSSLLGVNWLYSVAARRLIPLDVAALWSSPKLLSGRCSMERLWKACRLDVGMRPETDTACLLS